MISETDLGKAMIFLLELVVLPLGVIWFVVFLYRLIL